MKCVRWTQKEEDILLSLAGDLPWSIATRRYNQWATMNGYAKRSKRALYRRVHILGHSTRAAGQWLDTAAIAQLLGVHGETIRRWDRKGWVHVYQQGRKKYINRKSLVQLAKERPQLLAGHDRNSLFLLLEDEVLAARLAATKRKNTGLRAKVLCIETGLIYPSLQAAAQSQWVTRAAITGAVRRGSRCNGYHWKRVA